jgi:hypothetical protein
MVARRLLIWVLLGQTCFTKIRNTVAPRRGRTVINMKTNTDDFVMFNEQRDDPHRNGFSDDYPIVYRYRHP